MSDKKLKAALIKKTGVSRQAIEWRVRRIQEKYGPFSPEVAYGIVAQMAGIDASKSISDQNILAIIRQELDRIAQLDVDNPKPKTKTIVKTVTANIGKELTLSDPILGKQILVDAREMTTTFAELYVFENSAREVINRVLTKNLGPDWWDTGVKKGIRDRVQGRIETEDRNAWHGRRGSHPIYYSDISDLQSIIQRHWEHFKDIFPEQSWVMVRLNEIALSRNIIDHHNPLQKKDRQRLSIYLKDWHDQISANKSKII
ncbi:hypothetical protein KQH40_00140 [bacterium]|nr:hypothetical protein [bacterium]